MSHCYLQDTLVLLNADNLMEATCLMCNLCLLREVRKALLVDGRSLDAGVLSKGRLQQDLQQP